ncbi:signal peptidase I [Candidatus Parcubacteria bacterium]|nr:signal peptidase I [Patescibacteria group bacterium]MBU4482051.1 signal peptidase I [Patescibacteria group bacterium]MCG2687123.1 signal peptidase I [Candidatus Parcubacteria bacterium]
MQQEKQNLEFPQAPEGRPSFEAPSKKQEAVDSLKTFIWETVKIIIISLIIIIPVRYYLIQPFYVSGASMEPNFYDHEYLIIDEISYRFNEPQRGDIIVFKYPKNPSDYFIKRVIGLPGEKITIASNKITVANAENPGGFILDESLYLPANTPTPNDINITLGQDEYFVLGDNRTSSLDSRTFGPITRSDIIGRTWVRGWPLNQFTVFERPEY